MSAPISKKAGGAAAGVVSGGSVALAGVELLGQLPVLHGANPVVLKALGSLIVLIVSAYGASAGAWLVKESGDFVAYSAKQLGLVLVASEKAGVPASDVARVEAKLDGLVAEFRTKAAEEAEQVLSRWLPQAPVGHIAYTGEFLPADTAPVEVVPAPEPEPAPVVAPAPPAAPVDPVLSDDFQPASNTDPALAD